MGGARGGDGVLDPGGDCCPCGCRSARTCSRSCRRTTRHSRRSGSTSTASAPPITCTSSLRRSTTSRIEDASDVIEAYLERLRALPEIAKVDAGLFEPDKDWTYLQDRTFALIGPAATREALDRFSEPGLRDALVKARDLLGTPSPEIRQFVQSDPLGLLALVRDRFAGDRSFSAIEASRRGYLSADGRSRLVIATPAGPPFDSGVLSASVRSSGTDRSGNPCRGGREQRPSRRAAGAHRVRRRPSNRGRDRVDHEARGDAQQRDLSLGDSASAPGGLSQRLVVPRRRDPDVRRDAGLHRHQRPAARPVVRGRDGHVCVALRAGHRRARADVCPLSRRDRGGRRRSGRHRPARRRRNEHAARMPHDCGDVFRTDVDRLAGSSGAWAACRRRHGARRPAHAPARRRAAAGPREAAAWPGSGIARAVRAPASVGHSRRRRSRDRRRGTAR